MLSVYFNVSLAFLLIIVLSWHFFPLPLVFFYSAANIHTQSLCFSNMSPHVPPCVFSLSLSLSGKRVRGVMRDKVLSTRFVNKVSHPPTPATWWLRPGVEVEVYHVCHPVMGDKGLETRSTTFVTHQPPRGTDPRREVRLSNKTSSTSLKCVYCVTRRYIYSFH
jgi:hypothetical protein